MINYSVAGRVTTDSEGNSSTAYYAYTQYTSLYSFDEFCANIAEHGSVYRKSDIMGVLQVMVSCLREQVLNGKKIEVGDLGTFQAKAKSTAATTYASFDSGNFSQLTVKWTPGDSFDDMLDDATLNLVLTKDQQAAVAAAVAAGETSVDLSTDDSTEEDSSDTSDGSDGSEDDSESV